MIMAIAASLFAVLALAAAVRAEVKVNNAIRLCSELEESIRRSRS